jgi:hypothetical protein
MIRLCSKRFAMPVPALWAFEKVWKTVLKHEKAALRERTAWSSHDSSSSQLFQNAMPC